MTILSIRNLSVSIPQESGQKNILQNINIDVGEQGIVALVGGSGCGKTTIALSVLGLLPYPLRVLAGQIIFKGQNLLGCDDKQMRMLRGGQISMVFQEPLYAFNPVLSIGYQIDEVMKYHTVFSPKQRKSRIEDMLLLAGITEPKRVMRSYTHQLSGGMRQRAMIAQAIAANPKLLIADEPTSNIDVTIQARIMELFLKLKDELNLSVLLITHDMGIVKHLADEVVVLSNGRIVEMGKTDGVLDTPSHEYTIKLMEALKI